MFASFVIDSLAIAGQTLIAVALGAGRPREAREIADRLLEARSGGLSEHTSKMLNSQAFLRTRTMRIRLFCMSWQTIQTDKEHFVHEPVLRG
jgi:hypothetical protein